MPRKLSKFSKSDPILKDKSLKSQIFNRRKARLIHIGKVPVGGDSPITVQTMTKTHTSDIRATLIQIKKIEEAGCEIVRVAVPDEESVQALGTITKEANIPVVADIHFDHRLALGAIKKGVGGLRINPGNIGSIEKVKEVVHAAKSDGIPIRIGVNSGSLEKKLLAKYGGATPQAMVDSALRHVRMLEDLDFFLIKISLKASDVGRTLEAYKLLAEKVDYPFHAGITEAGSLVPGAVKSAVGLGLLLSHGLADTIRVSLTAPPEEEVRVGFYILSSLGFRSYGPNLISCPICGRCEVDLYSIAQKIEKELACLKETVDVAVMGCMVNGPGEAKEADIGLACGKGKGVIFKRGKLVRSLKEADIVAEFTSEVKKFVAEEK